MNLKQEIINFAKKIGIDEVGFAAADPFFDEKKFLEEKKKKGLLSPFEEQNISLRLDPSKMLPGAKTIICTAIGYLLCSKNKKNLQEQGEYFPKGRFSRYAIVNDYHFVLTEKLMQIVDFISKKQSGKFKIMVDTGAVLEKAAAQRAGLGWIGANTCFFTPKYGSWVFLGEIITDIEIEPDNFAESKCDGCGKCIKSCPTGALMAPYNINPYRCLSYITQMRGRIPEELSKLLEDKVFGCDTCQEACPHNQEVLIPNHNEFDAGFSTEIDLNWLLNLTKKEFEKSLKKTAAGWRGRNIIRRNAVCALANSEQIISKEMFEKLVNDPSPVVREQALSLLRNISCRKDL